MAGATATLRINEVSSTGGGADYVEFINPGPTAVNVGDWYFSDSQPGTMDHTFYFPPNTILQPGQIVVVSQGIMSSEFEFSLDDADSIIVSNDDGFEVERHSWTGGVNSSGRCPNGTGAFRTMTPTKGQPNACSADGGTD
jgi:hypothetical protein